ncbi:MAG: glutaredoxin family protein [Myxococcales bacterium]|nr:MAG: glutaredoxin family protein [Myxococcales bacterium]
MAVILYSLCECPYSQMLRAELDARGLDYEEIDVARQRAVLPELLKLTGGRRIVPVLVEGREVRVAPHGGTTF